MMSPYYREGQRAAQEGQTLQECPYSYSRIDPPMSLDEYVKSGNQRRNIEWMNGWRSVNPEGESQ